MKNLELWLLSLVLVVIGWSAWRPADWGVWWMEMSWVLGVFAVLLATARRFRFSTAAYAIVTIWLVMHTVGAHYTFEHVPFGWITDLFGFSRNHYDRVAHFAVGLNSFLLAELFYRKRWASGLGFAAFAGVIAIMAMACAWEIVEWLVAVWDGGADGLAFLGSQGDVWDAQKDMLADTLGAVVAATVFWKTGGGTMRQLLAPAIGFAKKVRRERPYCNPVVSKLSGCLKGMDTTSLWEGLTESSKIDEELWK